MLAEGFEAGNQDGRHSGKNATPPARPLKRPALRRLALKRPAPERRVRGTLVFKRLVRRRPFCDIHPVVHLVVLNGSPHSEGMTATVLRAMVAELESEHTVEWIDTHRLNVKACRGCMICRPEGECILPRDDGHRVGESLRRAGMILVGTPTYWGNMSAPLKLIFDRNVTTFESFYPGRPRPRKRGCYGYIVVTSGARGLVRRLPSQAAGAAHAVRTILRGGGVRILGRLLVGGRPTFAERRSQIEARARRRGRRLGRRLRRAQRLRGAR